MVELVENLEIWRLIKTQQYISPTQLFTALSQPFSHPDFRTKLLIKEVCQVLAKYPQFSDWISQHPMIQSILDDPSIIDDKIGFPSLEYRIMAIVTPQIIDAFLREVSLLVKTPTEIEIGGVTSLILQNLISRNTEDVDVVDEVPLSIRSNYAELDDLAQTKGLNITHFQSHYLPPSWRNRLVSYQVYGNLQVKLVDAVDIFVSKLFSARQKDRDDLLAVFRSLDKNSIVERLKEVVAWRREQRSLVSAQNNWFVVYGEQLPI